MEDKNLNRKKMSRMICLTLTREQKGRTVLNIPDDIRDVKTSGTTPQADRFSIET